MALELFSMATINYFHIVFIIVIFVNQQTYADPVVRNPIYESLDFLALQERGSIGEILSFSQTQQLVKIVWKRTGYCDDELTHCEHCLQAEDLFNIVEANATIGLQETHFERISVVLLYHLENQECQLPSANLTYSDYLEGLFSVPPLKEIDTDYYELTVRLTHEDSTFSEEQLRHILNVINGTYLPESENKCFTSESVFDDIDLEHNETVSTDGLERLSSVVLTNLLHGECIGNSHILNPDSFVEDLFDSYGTSGAISDHGFEHLMIDLMLLDGHDHFTSGSLQGSRKRRTISGGVTIDEEHDHHDHSHCHSPEQLMEVFDAHGSISYSLFLQMCPSLVQMLATDACHEEHETADPVEPSSLVYLWATLAVIFVTLASVSGILLFPLMSPKIYEGVMNFCIALAVSTLSGDALLHLLPESLGLHSHAGDDHDDHDDHAIEPEFVLGKILAVVAAIYVFFLFEKGLSILLGSNGHQHSHSHSPHGTEASRDEMDQVVVGEDNPDPDTVLEHEVQPRSNGTSYTPNVNSKGVNGSAKLHIGEQSPKRGRTPSDLSYSGATLELEKEEKDKQSFSLLRGMTSVSVMVLVGDVLHNFMDGIAIGVAFTLDIFVGISTCIAIFCHEFPHEIGDFVVLTKNGMTKSTAFTWIIITNLLGLGGVYCGIALGNNDSVHQWIFAVTAGFFLYVSLVDLMPGMLRDPNSSKPSVFILHNLGLLLGWFLLVLIAYFEEDIGKNVVPS